MGIADTIAPRSDQMNADDLLAGPRTFTITAVRVHEGGEQPVEVVLAEFPADRPWKPGKSMRRVLVALWGDDEQAYVGRRLTLYNDPDITFGPDKTGGIRISHASHIAGRKTMPLTVKRGSRKPFVVDKLPDAPTPAVKPFAQQVDEAIAWFEGKLGVTLEQLERRTGRTVVEWGDDDLAGLRAAGGAVARGEKHVDDEFPAVTA